MVFVTEITLVNQKSHPKVALRCDVDTKGPSEKRLAWQERPTRLPKKDT